MGFIFYSGGVKWLKPRPVLNFLSQSQGKVQNYWIKSSVVALQSCGLFGTVTFDTVRPCPCYYPLTVLKRQSDFVVSRLMRGSNAIVRFSHKLRINIFDETIKSLSN
jgi:hypothetical protein